eukprot:SM002154S06709  [mRNA]  locus=s2154:715:1273:- [translate_table: standard]
MYSSLCKTLAKLRPDTQVFCGHEYTLKNLEFAASVDPANEAVRHKLTWAKEQRAAGLPTVPSTIGEELEINPFMRVDSEAMQAATGLTSSIEIMGELRQRKNQS